MELIFYQHKNRVGVRYVLSNAAAQRLRAERLVLRYEHRDRFGYDLGLIPKTVVAEGEARIRAYAAEAARDHHEELVREATRRRDEADERRRNTREDISVWHGGEKLRGRISSHPSGGVIVHLLEPIHVDAGRVLEGPTCWASAVSGAYVFENDGTLTRNLRERAAAALVQIFEEADNQRRYGAAIELVEQLNRPRRKR